MTDILDKLADLYKQATEERSHNYTGSVIKEAITHIAGLRALAAIAQRPDAQSRCSAATGDARSFDTTGTVFRRVGKVLTITCETDEIANRVADQLRTPVEPQSVAWQPIETAPHEKRVLLGWHDWRDHQWCVEVGPAATGQRFGNGYSNLSQHGSATHWMPLPSPMSRPQSESGK